jgi:lysozyme
MAFNLGVGGLMDFKQMLAACAIQDWTSAAAEMLASEWSIQVGDRATVLARQMSTGQVAS